MSENGRNRTTTVATLQSSSVRSRPDITEEDAAARAERAQVLRQRYAVLLERFLDTGQEEVLLDVYRLGRQAVVEELGLLATTDLHQSALCELLERGASRHGPEKTCRLAGTALSELLSAYEMSCRGYREASTAMRHLNEMLEDEVRRVAHAIHDGAGQYLACVHLSLYAIAKHTSEEGKEELKHAHVLLEELEKDLRHVSHELRPRVLENAGLRGAVEFLVESVTQRTGLAIDLKDTLTQRPAGVIETALYRCIQELVNNITKHAQATQVEVIISDQGETILCEVNDNGIGFDAGEIALRGNARQLGFLGIQERIAVLDGSVDIQSTRGEGTRVRIVVPK